MAPYCQLSNPKGDHPEEGLSPLRSCQGMEGGQSDQAGTPRGLRCQAAGFGVRPRSIQGSWSHFRLNSDKKLLQKLVGELGSTANDLGSRSFYGLQKLQKEGSEQRFSDPFYECRKTRKTPRAGYPVNLQSSGSTANR